VRQRRHAFDDVPAPATTEPREDVDVVADERLAIDDDGEEVEREVDASTVSRDAALPACTN
jgi:hypothetical protein